MSLVAPSSVSPGVSYSITGARQAEAFEQQSSLQGHPMFAFEASVLSTASGRGRDAADGEVAAPMLLL